MDASTKAEIIDFLENKVQDCKALVIGDVMLDRYFYGNVMDNITENAEQYYANK